MRNGKNFKPGDTVIVSGNLIGPDGVVYVGRAKGFVVEGTPGVSGVVVSIAGVSAIYQRADVRHSYLTCINCAPGGQHPVQEKNKENAARVKRERSYNNYQVVRQLKLKSKGKKPSPLSSDGWHSES